MFVGALAAPLTVLQIVPLDEPLYGSELVDATKTKAQAKAPPLLGDGLIVPGEGIADLRLGDSAIRVISELPEPLYQSIQTAGISTVEHRGYEIGQTILEIQTDPDLDQLDAISLYVDDCRALLYYQPRQDGVPSTAGGLSIGSHASRVTSQLGEPLSGNPPQAVGTAPHREIYPGMTLEFCPENRLISSISIAPLPETRPAMLPLIAHALPATPRDATQEPERQLTLRTTGTGDAPPRTGPPPRDLLATAQVDWRQDMKPRVTDQDRDLPSNTAPTLMMQTSTLDVSGLGASLAATQSLPVLAARLPGHMATLPEHDLRPAEQPAQAVLAEARTTALLVPEQSPSATSPATPFQMEAAFVSTDAHLIIDPAPNDPGNALGALTELGHPPSGLPMQDPIMVLAAAQTEQALALSNLDRRRLQIRLRLMGYSPKGIDGIFGPLTRAAIMNLQQSEAMLVTGFLTDDLKSLIMDRSQTAYLAWRESVRLRAAETKVEPIIVARMPTARNAPDCARDEGGVIIDNQSFSCDVSVLQEGLSKLFSDIRS